MPKHISCDLPKINQERLHGTIFAFPLAQCISSVIVTLCNARHLLNAVLPNFSSDHIGYIARCFKAQINRLWCPQVLSHNGGVAVVPNKAESFLFQC